MAKYGVVLATLCLYVAGARAENPGPAEIATKGKVWPKPQQQNVTQDYFVLRPRSFQFKISKSCAVCGLLETALERYGKIIQENAVLQEKYRKYQGHKGYKKKWLQDDSFLGYLDELTVNLTGACQDDEYPTISMDEAYKLWVTPDKAQLQAATIWGVLRGLETFSQLVYLGPDLLTIRLNSTIIKDYPRYKHRGLLIDTSRHFIPVTTIYVTLDAMAYNKLNVFHWHIVDDQSFPYVSLRFPELSELGAFNRYSKVYFPEDVQNVIEYARIRGIRVLPEFDTPGHTASWGLAHPEILTPCEIYNTYGPMDPSRNTTFTFLAELFAEIRGVFKDDFIHLGGDEVYFECWMQDANISTFMKRANISTYEELESYYIQRVVNMAEDLKFSSVVWEEVFSNGVELPNETLVHVWKSGWTDTMKEVTAAGKYGLLSACWYLDDINPGGDWANFYYCDPTDFNGTVAEQALVLGGEACMWGEVVNEFNLMPRVWPRASATAEKLWSDNNYSPDLDDQARRLEEHACRMNRRGIAAQPPNGPGFCD